MPVVPRASRTFRTQTKPVISPGAHLSAGAQSPVFPSPGPKKSKLDEESSTEDLLTNDKRAPLYQRKSAEPRTPLYQRQPQSEFRPLIPEIRCPVTRSRFFKSFFDCCKQSLKRFYTHSSKNILLWCWYWIFDCCKQSLTRLYHPPIQCHTTFLHKKWACADLCNVYFYCLSIHSRHKCSKFSTSNFTAQIFNC